MTLYLNDGQDCFPKVIGKCHFWTTEKKRTLKELSFWCGFEGRKLAHIAIQAIPLYCDSFNMGTVILTKCCPMY